MKLIQKLKISNALISASMALTLLIAACSKNNKIAPMNPSQPKTSDTRLSAVSDKPSTVNIEVKGLDNEQHLNRKFQYRRIETTSGGGWGGRDQDRSWKEDLGELIYDPSQQKFVQTIVYPFNRCITITGPFVEGNYIFRMAYQVPGDNDRWFYTEHTAPVYIKAKQVPSTSGPSGHRKSMRVEADLNAAKAFPAYERGVIVLNFIELNNINLNDITSAIIKTKVSNSEYPGDYQKIDTSNFIHVTCDYINNRFIITGLATGIPYDLKINLDGVEAEVKNIASSGVRIIPTIN